MKRVVFFPALRLASELPHLGVGSEQLCRRPLGRDLAQDDSGDTDLEILRCLEGRGADSTCLAAHLQLHERGQLDRDHLQLQVPPSTRLLQVLTSHRLP